MERIPETDASQEDGTQTEESQEAEEKTAVSGQTYAVHVTAQDLHEDSSGDITVKLHLKDSETGLPITGISTGFGKTKEEALAGEATSLMEIPAGLPDQSLTVSRVQESTKEENGDTQVTADYITFQLPAGSTADFYIGITYTAQEEEYSQTLAMEAEAQQLVAEKVQSPQEETEVQPEAKPQPETSSEENQPEAEPQPETGSEESQPEAEPQPETSSEESQPEAEPQPETGSEENKPEAEAQPETGSEGPQSEAELQADFQSETQPEEALFALPGALETQVGESLDEPEEIPTVEETGETESAVAATDSQGTTPDADSTDEGSEGEKKLVNVLDGTAVVMLVWAAKAADGGGRPLKAGDWLYFDVSTSKSGNGDHWYEAGAKLFLKYGTDGKLVELEACKEKPHWYRVKITPEMESCDKFQFVRRNPDNTKEWGDVPQGSSLSFTNNYSSNVFRMTDYNNGAWVPGEWYTISYAGRKLYFFNMKDSQELTAEFSVTNNTSQVGTLGMAPESGNSNLYSVTIPAEADYDTVTFKDQAGSTLATAKILDDAYDPETTNTYYYAASEIEGDTYSTWGTYPEKNGKIAGKKLYLDNETGAFPKTDGEVKIQIGNGSQETLSVDNTESHMYLYTVPENSEATQQTIITLTKEDNIYRLLWGNLKKNKVTVTDNIANVAARYRIGYTVYYDATLSKLSYAGSSDHNGGKGIPYSDSETDKVYCYAVTKAGAGVSKGLSLVPNSGGNLWSVDLSPENGSEYTKIRFAGYKVDNENAAADGNATDLVDIPWELDDPCYYGDDSDDIICKGGNRGGYWDEKGSVRDAGSGKNQTVVDIASGSFTRKSDTLYVDSTFYDYYTDYELNGNNRDNYDNSDNSGSQRNWVTFRQFDQALSDYYKSRGVAIPIYIGHFQPSISGWGNPICRYC